VIAVYLTNLGGLKMPRELYGLFEQMWLEVIKLLGLLLMGVALTAIALCLLAILVSNIYESRMIRRDQQRDDGLLKDHIGIESSLIAPRPSLLRHVYMADDDDARAAIYKDTSGN
jgi:hypothetical protein